MTAPVLPRPLTVCLTCGDPIPGLLAGCTRPDCRREDLDYEAAFERYLDQ